MMAPVLLHIRFNDLQAHTPQGEATIENRHRRLDFEIAKELKLICDFEGNVDWLLGLTAQRPYRVFELNDPARLVVDVSRLEQRKSPSLKPFSHSFGYFSTWCSTGVTVFR